MLTLIFIISLLIVIFCGIVYDYLSDESIIAILISIIFTVVTCVLFFATLITLAEVLTSYTIDEKIALYEEESAEIEAKVEDLVKEARAYEHETYSNIIGEDVISMAIALPSLSSNEVVKEQIELYYANQRKVRELKEKKIDISHKKFLLYFGE